MNPTAAEEKHLESFQEILGGIPMDMVSLSYGYSLLIEDAIKQNKFNREYKNNISSAYRKLAEGICETEISKNGKFEVSVDFSLLDGVVVFPQAKQKITGVTTCTACSGLGEWIKFQRKPVKVACLKCQTASYVLNDEKIVVDGNKITVDGIDKTNDPKYNRLLGRVVEDCISCNGTGRYITESYIHNGEEIVIDGHNILVNGQAKTSDPKYQKLLKHGVEDYIKRDKKGKFIVKPKTDHLLINVECKTCRGKKFHPESKKTQILIKCKTCSGKRVTKIPVITPNVNTTTVCRVCSGMGFVSPKPGPENPVLTRDLASRIRTM